MMIVSVDIMDRFIVALSLQLTLLSFQYACLILIVAGNWNGSNGKAA